MDASSDQSAQADASDASADVALDQGASDAAADAIPYEAGALDECNPNVANSCGAGKKCCSEPTHKDPPSAYVCVTPTGNGTCPLLP